MVISAVTSQSYSELAKNSLFFCSFFSFSMKLGRMTENVPESRLVGGCQIWRHFKPGRERLKLICIDHAPRALCLFVSVLGRQFNLMPSSPTDEGMAVKPGRAEAAQWGEWANSISPAYWGCLLCTHTSLLSDFGPFSQAGKLVF